MILYLLAKFAIIKPRTKFNHSEDSIDAWRKIIGNSKKKEKLFGEVQGLPRFPRKMVLYLSTNFRVIKYLTNIPWNRELYSGFWQTSKYTAITLIWEKVFAEFQGLLHFPRKTVLYSSTKLAIINPLNQYSISQKVWLTPLTNFKLKL